MSIYQFPVNAAVIAVKCMNTYTQTCTHTYIHTYAGPHTYGFPTNRASWITVKSKSDNRLSVVCNDIVIITDNVTNVWDSMTSAM